MEITKETKKKTSNLAKKIEKDLSLLIDNEVGKQNTELKEEVRCLKRVASSFRRICKDFGIDLEKIEERANEVQKKEADFKEVDAYNGCYGMSDQTYKISSLADCYRAVIKHCKEQDEYLKNIWGNKK